MDPIAISSILLSLIALGFSFYSFFKNLRASSRPVLIFAMSANFKWKLQNVGNGPAINVIVLDIDKKNDLISATNCYPLAVNSNLELTWLTAAWKLVAIYTDIWGKKYETICAGPNTVNASKEYSHYKANTEQWIQEIIGLGRSYSALREKDLIGKTPFELDVMKNEPYARHGYSFKRQDLADYFNRQPWYVPRLINKFDAEKNFTIEERFVAYFILDYQLRHKYETDHLRKN